MNTDEQDYVLVIDNQGISERKSDKRIIQIEPEMLVNPVDFVVMCA